MNRGAAKNAARPAVAAKAIRPMDETRSASEGVRLTAPCRWRFASPDKKFAVSSAERQDRNQMGCSRTRETNRSRWSLDFLPREQDFRR
jgi:hypothetical protein